MKKRLLSAIAAAVVWPLAASAVGTSTSAGRTACSGGDKRICYESLAANGEYQQLVDIISLNVLAIDPMEQYFLGRAYSGLSNRTAAQSLRCFYGIRSKELLESFLTNRQLEFKTRRSFGTSDEMRYVYHATKTLDALKSVTGCEESSHTEESLTRYARRFANDRILGLFYNTDTDGQLGKDFRAKMSWLNDQMQDLVTTASMLETRYRMVTVELDAGKTNLLTIRDEIELQFGKGLVKAETTNADPFPRFSYDEAKKRETLKVLDDQGKRYEVYLKPGGRIATIEQDILASLKASSIEEYAQKKEATCLEVMRLSESLLRPVNYWQVFRGLEPKGTTAIREALAVPGNDMLFSSAASIDAKWRESMKGYCTPTSAVWYCKSGGA